VGGQVPCSVTLLGVQNKRREISAFVTIFRDMSEKDRQEQEAAEAKDRNERLLYEILPRGVVSQINQGQKDISFVVESCSLQFIDIQKFSDYAARLSPAETMVNLSSIFTGYDANLPKYDLVMKMKLIGDVYMVSAGLFAPKANPSDHASQIISFGLDALDVIDETNVRLDANLSVRIGVNSGGPVIAGVLGQAAGKPLFDILGDPINIAARLQSTDIPGKVQISESTFALVQSGDFSIEPRGEVFLKGKGMRPAYLVSRKPISVFHSAFGGPSQIGVSGTGATLGKSSFRRAENSGVYQRASLHTSVQGQGGGVPRPEPSAGLHRLEALLG
jgi:class 3 adenylate cyclase